MKLPAPPPTTIWQDMAAFQKFAEDIQARMTDPAQKRMLGDMLQQLTAARAHAQEVVPDVLQKMKQEAEKQQAEAPQVSAELERLQAELQAKREEAQKLAEATPAPTPPTPPKADKARELGEELRSRFVRRGKPEEKPLEDAGSVAREWVEPEAPERPSAPPVSPARKPTQAPKTSKEAPAEKPEKKPEDDIWEGLSRMEGDGGN